MTSHEETWFRRLEGLSVAGVAELRSGGLHVVSRGRFLWAVFVTGRSRASRVFESKEGALEYARRRARRDSLRLYIHRPDGTVESRGE